MRTLLVSLLAAGFASAAGAEEYRPGFSQAAEAVSEQRAVATRTQLERGMARTWAGEPFALENPVFPAYMTEPAEERWAQGWADIQAVQRARYEDARERVLFGSHSRRR
ncbi:hypothetical protein U91I_02385 [alpha proteobacterium U9-1i]|nr:hypothetical protein U91I_02385 [alpha proteobacterium U9-1i]